MNSRISFILLAPVFALALAACGGGGGKGGGNATPPAPIDTTPPDTILNGAPTGVTAATSATFSFTSSETGSTFEASIDGGPFAVFSSPHQLNGLSDGPHSFAVRARDLAGNADPTPATANWVVDTIAPNTTITSAPVALTNSTTATVAVTATELPATFEVSVDGAAYATVVPPIQLSNLAEGAHTALVRARDSAGNVDLTPATANWVVDTTAPNTTITSAPAALTNSTTATVTVTATELPATFEVSVDGAAYATVVPPIQLSNLAEGAHTVLVRARDSAGNVDSTPASVQWQVDITAPNTTLTATPPTLTNQTSVTIAFAASEPGATFQASIDAAAFVTANSPLQITSLTAGQHTIAVRALDAVGNVDASPATFSWFVDLAAPAATIVFPPPFSYTDADTLTVRGSASDANGVSAVRVNGIAVTTTDAFLHWTASVPIAGGTNTVTVSVTDAAGNTQAAAASAVVTNRGPAIVTPTGIAYDSINNRVLIADQDTDSVYTYNATDGIGRLLSDRRPPFTRPFLSLSGELVVDAANNRALLVDWGLNSIVSVDLTNGIRFTVAMGELGSGGGATGKSLVIATGIALDAANNRAFVTVGTSRSVLEINLADGTITIVASPTIGSGTALTGPNGIAYDTSTGTPRLLIADGAGIVAIDLTNGVRSVMSAAGIRGTGVAFEYAGSVYLDSAANRLLVTDASSTSYALVAVNLTNGNRTTLADATTGTGAPMALPFGVTVNSTNGDIYLGLARTGEVLKINRTTLNREVLVHANTGGGERIYNPTGLVLERTNGVASSLLFLEPEKNSLVRADLATGNRTTITGPLTAGSYLLNRPIDVKLDTRASTPTNAFVLDSGGQALVNVNLTSGIATRMTGLTSGARNIALDVASNRVVVTDATAPALYAVNLASGMQTNLSGLGRGNGSNFQQPLDVALSPAVNPTTAYVTDTSLHGIHSVDLALGNRTVLQQGSAGYGVPIELIGPIALDSARQRLIAVDLVYTHIAAVDLTTGSREMISGIEPIGADTIGGGPPLEYITGLDLDDANQVAYIIAPFSYAIIAVDLVSGDRVIVSR